MTQLSRFDSCHAFDIGYHFGLKGMVRACPRGTWLGKFWRDFYAGYDAATGGRYKP